MSIQFKTIGDLRELIKNLPDDMEVDYTDPNFGTRLDYDDMRAKIMDGVMMFEIPFVSDIEEGELE